jgi:hypothetical protein
MIWRYGPSSEDAHTACAWMMGSSTSCFHRASGFFADCMRVAVVCEWDATMWLLGRLVEAGQAARCCTAVGSIASPALVSVKPMGARLLVPISSH